MPNFIMTYLGGNPPATPEEGQRHFKNYQEWLGSLGDSVVSPMNPIKNTHLVAPSGDVVEQGVTKMSGYTVIKAESMEAALAMAGGCPFLDIGGSLEVSELVTMGE